MSLASKCDRCGALYEPKLGDITIGELYVQTEKTGTCDSWSEIALCSACSVTLYQFLELALVDPPAPL